MEYQKIANFLNDALNKPSKFRTRNWVEINDVIRGAYSPNKQTRFKTAMLRSSLCDYSDAYILVKGNITVNNNAVAGAVANNIDKKVIFKNCAPFTNCLREINNTQIDNAEYIDIIIPMYNLIEYSDNYSKRSGSLWQYFKTKITGKTNGDGIINVEIMVPLKYLSNFWRTLEIPLINCKVELILTWSADCVITYTDVANQNPTFTTTETNLYVPVVTFSSQDDAKLLPQLKSGFKRTVSWNRYLSKPELLARMQIHFI